MPLPKSNQPKPPRTAKERIYQTLLEWIIDGTLAPGGKTQRFGNFQIF